VSPHDAALDGAAEGSLESTTEVAPSRPSADEVEVEAASAAVPTDPDVEAAPPAVRQQAAAEAGSELPASDESDAPAPQAGRRRPARRRAARTAPTTAVVTEGASGDAGSANGGSPSAGGSGSEPSGDTSSGDPVPNLS
jgi:hypothetical protein